MRVLYNSNAGSAAQADVDALGAVPGVELVDCQDPNDTIDAAADAAHSGIDLVVAAGGDGTVHLVANGLMRAGPTADTRPALGVLPLGTGNDLARTLGLPLKASPIEALDALRRAERHCLDLIRVSHDGDDEHTDYAVNVCAGGFSGTVDEILTSEMKQTWGPLAYLVGAVKAMPDLRHGGSRNGASSHFSKGEGARGDAIPTPAEMLAILDEHVIGQHVIGHHASRAAAHHHG